HSGNVEFTVCCLRASSALRAALTCLDCTPDLSATRDRILRLAGATAARNDSARPKNLSELSRREREVLGLVAQGLSNRSIARSLFISESTVKVHLRHVYEKLGVRSRTQAALFARDVERTEHGED